MRENIDNKQKDKNNNKSNTYITSENLDNKDTIKEEENKDLYSLDYIKETFITNKNNNKNNNINNLKNINKINNPNKQKI